MRLQSMAADSGIQDLKQFAEWILQVSNGISEEMSNECNLISIPPKFLITYYSDPIQEIVEAIYSDYIANMDNKGHLKGRAILAPTINAVDEMNDYMTELNNNACKTYLSSNKCLFEGGSNEIGGMYTPEFLATIKCFGVPNHELKLKVGCPVKLIRNIDRSSGLCNGTRLIITRLGDKVIETRLLNSDNCVDKVFIHRMALTPSDARLPFRFQRRQFPLMLSYAMTINKSQGKLLDHIGLLLKNLLLRTANYMLPFQRSLPKKD